MRVQFRFLLGLLSLISIIHMAAFSADAPRKSPEKKLATTKGASTPQTPPAPAPAPRPRTPFQRPPLPPASEVYSELATAGDAIDQHLVSHGWPGEEAADLTQAQVDDINQFVKNKKIPNELKFIFLERYEIGEQRVTDALKGGIKAKIGGIDVTTDFNTSMDGEFPNGEKFNADFSVNRLKKENGKLTVMAEFVQQMVDAGMVFSNSGKTSPYQIGSQPIYNPHPISRPDQKKMDLINSSASVQHGVIEPVNKGHFQKPPTQEPNHTAQGSNDGAEKPIQHLKTLILYTAKRLADGTIDPKSIEIHFEWLGTANMNEHAADGQSTRYNRMVKIKDPVFQQALLDHAFALKRAYAQGKPTEQMEVMAPVRVFYKDYDKETKAGTFAEIAYTDGRVNWNDRITLLFERAAKPDGGIRIKNVLSSHFVFTNTHEIDAFKEAMLAQPGFGAEGIVDQKFIATNGYGLAGQLAGFLVSRPFGGARFPFPAALRKRINLHTYQRLIEGLKSIPAGGAPWYLHLWHDKTTIIDVEEQDAAGNWHEYTYVFTGSLNNSNHYQNEEIQVMFRFKKGDPQAERFRDSILKVIKNEPLWAVPLEEGIMRETIARLTERSEYQMSIEDIDALQAAIRKGDLKDIRATLLKIANAKSTSERKTDMEAVTKRIESIVKYAEWYEKTVKPITGWGLNEFYFERMANATSTDKTGEIQQAVEFTVYGVPEEKRADVVKDAMKKVYGTDAVEQTPDKARFKSAKAEEEGKKPTQPESRPKIRAGLQAVAKAEEPVDLPYWNFDWDDNIFNMPTKIVIFKKGGRGAASELELSTDEYAKVRDAVGKRGKYKDYEVRDNPKTGSFRNFRDKPGKNIFFEDGVAALKTSKTAWKGPSWEAFKLACSTAESAKLVTIITAREQSVDSIYAFLVELQRRGEIGHVPEKKNIYAEGKTADPSKAKVGVIMKILDHIESTGTNTGMFPVLNADGTKIERVHTWGFSDDDFGNFDTAVKMLGAEIKRDPNRWKDIKVTLFYTGKTLKQVPPHAVVLKSDGTVRAARPEDHTSVQIMKMQPSCNGAMEKLIQAQTAAQKAG